MDQEDEGGGDIPEWVVTFGDMMSLLLAFFIMLFSMSEMKKDEKYKAMLESMRQVFGHEASQKSMLPGDAPPRNSMMQSIASMGRAKRKDLVRGGNKIKSVTGESKMVRTIRPGLDTTVGGLIFFDEESAEIRGSSKQRLREIADQIKGKPQKIEVRGHASRKPLANSDHWTIAYDRAVNVMQELIAIGVTQERIRVSSAGSFEPLDTKVGEENRKRNARVEVLMWDETFEEQ